MKRTLLFIAYVLASMTISAQEGTTVEDIQDSGCLGMTRGDGAEQLPTIVLTKEGSVMSVQLLNYESNCGTVDFNVTSAVSGGSDGVPYSVNISVIPNVPFEAARCYCLFNVSFTVRDVEANSFYLSCWWYKGQVELTEGEPLVLEYKVEDVTIDDISFKLLRVMHKAMLMDWTTTAEEVHIPSEVNYDSETYTVMGISKDAFWNVDQMTKVTLPKSIRSMDLDIENAIWANPFRECNSLEWIEVEEGCPLFSSVDGVLFAEDKRMLLGYPIASPRETYIVPEGVTNIRSGAFVHNKYLRKLVIPEEVTNLGWHLFDDMKSLEELYIKGVLDSNCMRDLFGGMETKVAVYVQPSELEKFQAIYRGKVYPLPDNDQYRPLVEEGKHWTYDNYLPVRPDEYNHGYSYDLKGDTLIAGKNCLKMYSDNRYNDGVVRYEAALYEENKKVFCFFPEKEEAVLLYDFDCEVGDTLNVYEAQMVVTDIQPAITGDVLIRKYTLLSNWNNEEFYEVVWIEGVGATKDFFAMVPFDGNYNSLYACELNGENLLPEPAYRPFVEEGKVWKVGDYSGNPVRRVEYFYFDSDTIIDGKACKQMMCQRYVSPEHPDYSVFSQFPSQSYIGAWYEEDKKVYKYDPTDKEFQLMYDFSLDANDTLWIKNASLPYIVGPRRTGGFKGFKGVYREVMQCYDENPCYNTTWLEGVGDVDGPILNVYYGKEDHAVFLMSCTVEDEVIYLNDEVEDGATPEIMDAQNRRIDFTHTIKTKPKSPMKREAERSLYGEYNQLQLGINLDPIFDAYQVRIADETGNVVYEKAIDAAGIVGLNIDISAYEKGLYTVAVENDQEAFTGVFEVQTTSLSPLLQEESVETIYNLLGQRMSSLRKGLNIVNGRKVYVP